jgi:hypothetical protein
MDLWIVHSTWARSRDKPRTSWIRGEMLPNQGPQYLGEGDTPSRVLGIAVSLSDGGAQGRSNAIEAAIGVPCASLRHLGRRTLAFPTVPRKPKRFKWANSGRDSSGA